MKNNNNNNHIIKFDYNQKSHLLLIEYIFSNQEFRNQPISFSHQE